MIQEALKNINYSWFAVIALLLFVASFVSIGMKAFFSNRETVNRQANLPLSDGQRGEIDV